MPQLLYTRVVSVNGTFRFICRKCDRLRSPFLLEVIRQITARICDTHCPRATVALQPCFAWFTTPLVNDKQPKNKNVERISS